MIIRIFLHWRNWAASSSWRFMTCKTWESESSGPRLVKENISIFSDIFSRFIAPGRSSSARSTSSSTGLEGSTPSPKAWRSRCTGSAWTLMFFSGTILFIFWGKKCRDWNNQLDQGWPDFFDLGPNLKNNHFGPHYSKIITIFVKQEIFGPCNAHWEEICTVFDQNVEKYSACLFSK